jgi:hypothetical protein
LRNWLRWLPLAGVTVALLVASLYPFDLDVDYPRREENRLERLDDGSLRFVPPSMARTAGPPEWLAQAIQQEQLTVAIEARTSDPEQAGPSRLFTVSRDSGERDFTIAQERADLHVRVRRPGANVNGLPALVVPHVFAEDEWRTIELEVDAEGVRVTVDGDLAASEPLAVSPFPSWDAGYALALGDEVTGDRGWKGELRRAEVTVNGEVFDALDSAALETPEHFWYVPERWRSFVQRDRAGGLGEAVAHTLAFSLLGIGFVVAAGPKAGFARIVGAAVAMLVALELLQLGFDGRHPVYIDLLTGALGASLGAFAARLAWPRLAA